MNIDFSLLFKINAHYMSAENSANLIPDERIIDKIFLIRGQKVMLDRDLAILYGVETKRLKEAVKRN